MAETVTVALRVRGGTTSEDPSAALLELTEPLAQRLLARIDQVAAIGATDPEVRYLVLRGEQLTWYSNWDDTETDAPELGEAELLDSDWDEVSAERLAEIEALTAAYPEVESFVEAAELVVDRDGVGWRAYPKYGEETFTTAALSRESLVELARRWQLA